MSAFPDPIWPVIVLAIISVGDALLCIKPAAFIAQCFVDVGWPSRLRWVLVGLKSAAAVGLIVGLWIPYLGAVTSVALVAYFVAAIGAHLRARDFGRNLFVNATGMLVICIAVLLFSFIL